MAALEENHALTTIAQGYAECVVSDPDNAAVWSFCAAVAFKRTTSEGAESAQFAQQTAGVLQAIMEGTGNPCRDAIPSQCR